MAGTGQSPIHLTILRQGEVNIVDLAEVGSLIPRSETQVNAAFLHELAAEVTHLAAPGYGRKGGPDWQESLALQETGPVVQDLQRIGELIFSHLLTEPARKRLRTAEPCDMNLRLDEQLIHIPWELCYDGSDFLAMKFRVGRQVITSYPVPGGEPAWTVREPLKVLLIADPTESLPQAGEEADRLCAQLDTIAGVEVTLLGGKGVRKVPLLAALQAHDVIHFAGHSYYDPENPTNSGWRLHEGVLTAGELSKLSHPPLLVFSNSCQAGTTSEWESSYRYEGQAFGIGSAFLLAGVKNYIGTFWVVHDEESELFATAFYRRLVAGCSLGEALLQARQAVISQRGWQSLTWASYMLYGDPTLRLLSPASEPHSSQETAENRSKTRLLQEPTQSARKVQRKLSALLSADVKGYSRLMGDDEEATVHTLTAYRGVMAALIQQYRGRVVDAPGDNVLAEFGSVVDATQCATTIQQALKERNSRLASHRRMEFRIGINLGDVILEGEQIYGDGVNIAARLEGLAEGGGICISGTVYDQVKNKLAFQYEYLGEQTVKNILEPVRVYRLHLETRAQVLALPQPASPETTTPPRRPVYTRWLILLVTGALGVLMTLRWLPVPIPWRVFPVSPEAVPAQNRDQPDAAPQRNALPLVQTQARLSPSEAATPSPAPTPSQPRAIGVMYFKALREDAQLGWMREAIRDNFNSQLSNAPELKVYSKEYLDFLVQKGAATEIEVANQLGIAKMISGSFLAIADTLRIEAHIVDVQSGVLEASEHVEGEQRNFFALHRQLARKIMARFNIAPAAQPSGETPAAPPASSLDAYRLLLEAEGETTAPASDSATSSRTRDFPASAPDALSRLPRGWLGPSTAWAQGTLPSGMSPEDEIRQILERYRQAYEKKDLTLLDDVYDTLSTTQKEANAKYFQQTQDLKVTIRDVDIAVLGNEAAMSYTREDHFVDAKSGKAVTLEVRFTKFLVRLDDSWKISSKKKERWTPVGQ